MLDSWTWVGKIALLSLLVLLVIVILPVLFVFNDYPTIPWWDVAGFLACLEMLPIAAGIVSEGKKKGSLRKNHEIGMFFILSTCVIIASAGGVTITQTSLDQMQFTTLVNAHPVNLLAGYQAWNYSFSSDNCDDLLVSIDGYAVAPCGVSARLQYTWAVYQDGAFISGGDVKDSNWYSCYEEGTSDGSVKSHWYTFNFMKQGNFNISITISGVSFPENIEESISFSIYGTTGYSGMWVRRDELRFHFIFPLGMVSTSVVIAMLGLVGVGVERYKMRRRKSPEIVWKSPPSTPNEDL
jgi:hypothetical protein